MTGGSQRRWRAGNPKSDTIKMLLELENYINGFASGRNDVQINKSVPFSRSIITLDNNIV